MKALLFPVHTTWKPGEGVILGFDAGKLGGSVSVLVLGVVDQGDCAILGNLV